MAITFQEKQNLWKLDTDNTTYMIGLSPEGYVGHVYYGRKIDGEGSSYLLRMEENPFTPSTNNRDKLVFMESFPMEYPGAGTGDYRECCIKVSDLWGSSACEPLYESFEIVQGKPKLPGLPATFGTDDEVTTLKIICKDFPTGTKVTLLYSVFEKEDVIARSVSIENVGTQPIWLDRAYSAALDLDQEDFEVLTMSGAWARERQIQRIPLGYGKQMVSSLRGETSHQEHPFMALVTPNTTQTTGDVYAMHFVYSGNFKAQANLSQFGSVRMTMGIHEEEFRWHLAPGQSFQTPEVILTFSAEGLGKMSRSLHNLYRNHLIRSAYKDKERPILINNWEATYFDFDTEKLLSIAREAKKLGIEMLVMDDGWFGHRNDDNTSLGDWFVNEEKLPGGLEYLVSEVNKIGLKFGIWFEPEMISPESVLYKTHPEWAIRIPGRTATLGRNQYVLDLSRPEVIDYVYECVAKVLRSANIAYVKWDMNRGLTDLGSAYLDENSQGELSHRYVLGVYELQDRLIREFPDLLLENCSGGGARFDPGMLYFSPQIWCSDDTDAIERLSIQEGTALIYPLSTMGAHVSACPNHTVGRSTPFATRGHVALAGTFGYELDVTAIPEEERAQIPAQTAMYHKYNELIRTGDYYRLASYRENHLFDAYMIVDQNAQEAIMTFVQVMSRPNWHSRKIRLTGLDAGATYRIEEILTSDTSEGERSRNAGKTTNSAMTYSGSMLMNAGFLVEPMNGDYQSRIYHFVKIS